MIEEHIHKRFPGNSEQRVVIRLELIKACNEFVEQGLADPKFISELTSGQDSKFWSRVSEALLAASLRGKHFPDRAVRGEGPDFLVMDGDRRVWVEVICPEPVGISSTWSKFQSGEAIDFPHEQILLRWTSAIKVKSERLVGNVDGTMKGYLQEGIVAPNDAYVIAVNGCQLRNGPFPQLLGISQFPFAAEAVFPLGPLQLIINKETRNVVEQRHQHRPYLRNANKAPVPTYMFSDRRFNSVSAIWAVDLNGSSALGTREPMAVVHNPNALNRVSIGFLPSHCDYVATDTGSDQFTLTRASLESALCPRNNM